MSFLGIICLGFDLGHVDGIRIAENEPGMWS